MSVIDTIVDAVSPEENENARREARAKAKAAAQPGDWLASVLQHHEAIEAAFAGVKSAGTAAGRTAAQKRLAVLLTGHANAEESVLYPALTKAGKKGHATTAYSEQATAKTEMAALESLSPLSPEYMTKLEHIRDAVAHHMYEEEGTWFLELRSAAPTQEQALLVRRYLEEFDRYVGSDDPTLNSGRADLETATSNGRVPSAVTRTPRTTRLS